MAVKYKRRVDDNVLNNLIIQTIFLSLAVGSEKFQFGLTLLCVLSMILCNFGTPFLLRRPLKHFRWGGGAWPSGPPANTPLIHLSLRQITQTSALIILDIILNLIQ
jgi:hypothetical protein